MKKIFIVLFALVVILVSCDQDNIGTIYEPNNDYVAFSSPVVVDNFLTADNNYSLTVQIARSNVSESGTIANVSLEMTEDIDGVFELENSTVTFEDGKGFAYVKIVPLIPPSSLNPAKTYVFNLTLTGDNASEIYGTTTYKASLQIDFTSAGVGTFGSTFFEDTWSVELLKADLGDVTLYKAKELYDVGYDILIIVEGNNVSVNAQPAWYYDSEYGDVYIVGSGTISGKILTMSLEHYIPEVYSWESWTEVLTLP